MKKTVNDQEFRIEIKRKRKNIKELKSCPANHKVFFVGTRKELESFPYINQSLRNETIDTLDDIDIEDCELNCKEVYSCAVICANEDRFCGLGKFHYTNIQTYSYCLVLHDDVTVAPDVTLLLDALNNGYIIDFRPSSDNDIPAAISLLKHNAAKYTASNFIQPLRKSQIPKLKSSPSVDLYKRYYDCVMSRIKLKLSNPKVEFTRTQDLGILLQVLGYYDSFYSNMGGFRAGYHTQYASIEKLIIDSGLTDDDMRTILYSLEKCFIFFREIQKYDHPITPFKKVKYCFTDVLRQFFGENLKRIGINLINYIMSIFDLSLEDLIKADRALKQ